MDPVTMMVASIGMQFFTQHATSKKNAEIQEKQREFQKAAAEHDFERMRRLQSESAKLALEIEAEVHQERIKDINDNYDTLLENFAHSFAIQNWPLNVLPFVMKGESFGTLINGTTQSVNMHCVLTPSNCVWFNEMFFDDIDLQVEAEMNNNWNAQTTHPVVYYGGGWNRREMRHGISVPKEIDLDDIDLLKVKLKSVPVVVITPYFDPWLHFRVQLWGMGKDSEAPFRIDIPHGDEIDFSDRIFSYDYCKERTDEMTNDFINTTIEEFVPYIESLIGFIADKYFWRIYRIQPVLYKINKIPAFKKLISNSNIKNYIEYSEENTFDINTSIEYLNTIRKSVSTDSYKRLLDAQANAIDRKIEVSVGEIKSISKFISSQDCTKEYKSILTKLTAKQIEELELIENVETEYEKLCDLISHLQGNALNPRYFIFCLWNANAIIGTFCEDDYSECLYEKNNSILYFALLKGKLNDGIGDRKEAQFFSIDLLDNYSINSLNDLDMKELNDKKKATLKERVGRKLVENGYRFMGRSSCDVKSEVPPDPWGENTRVTEQVDELENILSFFIKGVDNSQIPFEKMGKDMSMAKVIDWLDSLDDQTVNNLNQLYVVRGIYAAKNKIVFCAFLAKDDKFSLEKNAKVCFICDSDNEEMEQLFNKKSVYVIPFEN